MLERRFFSSVFSFCKIKGYSLLKYNCWRLCVRNLASGLLQIGHKLKKMTMTSQLFDMTSSSNFFDVILFLLSILVTVLSFLLIWPLVLELWQFSFIRDWPEIRKLEVPLSEFYPISGDWGKLRIPNLARIFLRKC